MLPRLLPLMGERWLFFDGLFGFFPSAHSTFEVVEILEPELVHFFAGAGAPATDRAMDQVGFVLIELGEFLLEVVFIEIDQH